MAGEDIKNRVIISAEDKTAAGVDAVIKRFQGLQKVFTGFATADFFGINARSIANFATAGFRSADALGAIAAQTGQAFNSISQLSVAADLADVPLEKLVASSVKLGSAIQDQLIGKTGPAQAALARLGLSTEQLRAVQNDSIGQFRLVADALAKLEDGNVKVALAADIFGAKGTEVLRLLNQGSQAFDDAAEAAKNFGTELSEIDVSLLNEADRSFTLLRQQVEATERLVAAKLAPTFIGFTALAQAGLKGVAVEAQESTGAITKFNAGVATILDLFEIVFRVGQAIFIKFDSTVSEVAGTIVSKFADVVEIVAKSFELLGKALPSVFNKTAVAVQGAAEFLRSFADEAQSRVNRKAAEFIDLYTTPLTAGSIFFEATEEAKRAAAEIKNTTDVVKEAIAPGVTPPEKPVRDKDAEELSRLRDRLREQAGAISESLLTEEQMIEASFATRSSMLAEALARDAITQEEYDSIFLELERNYQAQKYAIVDEAANLRKGTINDLVNFENLSFAQQVQTITSLGAQLLSNISSKNKALFAVQKAFAIGNAIISTYQGAANALATVPYPFNFVAAASVVAAGIAQVAKIRSAQPGGGVSGGVGGGGASVGGGGVGAGVQSPSTGAPGTQPPSNVFISLQGNSYSRADVIELIEQINGVVGDGVRLETGA